jgi:iron complex outermembrane receptor protein
VPLVAAAADGSENLANLSLEELSNVEITSVLKRSQPLSQAPASVYVITADDIRRAGVTSLPEALRLAPNLQVAQVSASGYAISARGFNAGADKLLVLIDGRSVYTPLFAGVFWDEQNVMLEDIERIEVISGPAGTLWGVNAVNGVINIITRSAQDTQGGLVVAGGGNRQSLGEVRYGGPAGDGGSYRLYGMYFDDNHTSTASGQSVDDAWHDSQAGFRADWGKPGEGLTLIGNVYRGKLNQPAPGEIEITGLNFGLAPVTTEGENLTARWAHRLDAGSSVNVQAYYDQTERTVPPFFAEILRIADVQAEYSFSPLEGHNLTLGAEYRYGMDRLRNSPDFAFLPADLNQTWASLFGQDEIALSRDVRLTLGERLEHNDYTGMESLPSARLAWQIAPSHLVWTGASHTVRAPSRLDHDPFIPANPPFLLAGGTNVRGETADVYEVGYRGTPVSRVSYSLTVFHAIYDHLVTAELAPSQTSLVFSNEMKGRTTGVETWGTVQVLAGWRVSAGYTALNEKLELKPGSIDIGGPIAADSDPAFSWMLRSSFDLPARTEFDLLLRRVAALSNPTVPSYTALGARLGWKPRPDLELSVTGQNLTGSGHAEFSDPVTRSEFARSVFFKLLTRF